MVKRTKVRCSTSAKKAAFTRNRNADAKESSKSKKKR